MPGNIYRYDNGTVIEFTVMENGQVVDLTSVSEIRINISTPIRNFNKVATLTNRISGLCEIELVREDLADVGGYQIQGVVTFNDGKEFASDMAKFYVNNRLKV